MCKCCDDESERKRFRKTRLRKRERIVKITYKTKLYSSTKLECLSYRYCIAGCTLTITVLFAGPDRDHSSTSVLTPLIAAVDFSCDARVVCDSLGVLLVVTHMDAALLPRLLAIVNPDDSLRFRIEGEGSTGSVPASGTGLNGLGDIIVPERER